MAPGSDSSASSLLTDEEGLDLLAGDFAGSGAFIETE